MEGLGDSERIRRRLVGRASPARFVPEGVCAVLPRPQDSSFVLEFVSAWPFCGDAAGSAHSPRQSATQTLFFSVTYFLQAATYLDFANYLRYAKEPFVCKNETVRN